MKVFPFSRLECSESIFVFHYHDSWYFIPVPGPRKEICHSHLGKKRPSSQWISLQFVFSVLTKWNGFQIMNAFLLELVGMWCLK